jgi:hypothetical protein
VTGPGTYESPARAPLFHQQLSPPPEEYLMHASWITLLAATILPIWESTMAQGHSSLVHGCIPGPERQHLWG